MAKASKGPAKNIFLFSDGTGNSSGKLQKTNVWRLYEALDLGIPAAGSGPRPRVQIAYYDNGVGTSAVPLLAALGGAFGFGLARNVRALYKYLCRNYRPGDRIYAFGFSRGAFTIRLLVALIACIGVVQAKSETDLDLMVHDAWREFRRDFEPYWLRWITRSLRGVGRVLINLKRLATGREGYAVLLRETEKERPQPDIHFVGVWDTVAAYGGPVVEVTRAIDLMIWPLSMNDFRLSEKVLCARHALAIDDKRDSFVPLPWDERHEKRLVEGGAVKPDRLQQVFFAGMHSDVGGGYADDSLSLVSLVWMIEQASGRGARLLPIAEQRIRATANSFGPIHDSRRGIGLFYRYQIRPIMAWLFPRRPASWPHLDPAAHRGPDEKRDPAKPARYVIGRHAEPLLEGPIKLHCSVVARLDGGTDGYAPNNLPVMFQSVDDKGAPLGKPRSYRGVARSAAWSEQFVAVRRGLYFTTIGLVVILFLMPWIPEVDPERYPRLYALLSTHNDDRDLAGPIYGAFQGLLPGFLHSWANVWVYKFWLTLPIVLMIFSTIAAGQAIERKMSDHFAAIYQGGREEKRPAWRLASVVIRSRLLNRLNAYWKWYIVPAIVGSVMLAASILLVTASISQFTMFVGLENRRCGHRTVPATQDVTGTLSEFHYQPRHGCTRTGLVVKEGQTYTLELSDADWTDGGIRTRPDGTRETNLSQKFVDWMGVPFRRVARAPYLAPIVEIVPSHGYVMLQRVKQVDYVDGRWTGTFTATRSGSMLLFLNDAVLPLDFQTVRGGYALRVFDVRVRAFNNAFANPKAKGKAMIWKGTGAPDSPVTQGTQSAAR